MQRVETEGVAERKRRACRPRRRVREEQRVHTHHQRSGGGDLHRRGQRVRVKHLADEHSRGDPADGAEHANDREVARRIDDMMERHRVGERQRRHVAERVREEQRIEGAPVGLRRHQPHEPGAGEVQKGEQFFGREKAIGHDAEEERRHERGDGCCTVRQPDLGTGELQRLTQVRPHRHEPGAPDEVLEEHHGAESCARRTLGYASARRQNARHLGTSTSGSPGYSNSMFAGMSHFSRLSNCSTCAMGVSPSPHGTLAAPCGGRLSILQVEVRDPAHAARGETQTASKPAAVKWPMSRLIA